MKKMYHIRGGRGSKTIAFPFPLEEEKEKLKRFEILLLSERCKKRDFKEQRKIQRHLIEIRARIKGCSVSDEFERLRNYMHGKNGLILSSVFSRNVGNYKHLI